ncbi:hypothetical protein A2U01_0044993, partial [Trifolium medium]|nr:hypothetical protein [Trifolium medium]
MCLVSNSVTESDTAPTHVNTFKYGTPTIFDGLFTSSTPSFDTDIPCLRCGDCREIKTDGVISSCLDCFLSG